MKLIIVILSGADTDNVIHKLLERDFRFTRLTSSGGFLRRGNTTLLIGTAAERVDEAVVGHRLGENAVLANRDIMGATNPAAAEPGTIRGDLALEMGASWAGEDPAEMPVAADSAILFAPAGELIPPALRALKKGGTLSLAGIHMSDVPSMKYEECLFYEKNLRSVTANTRRDGEDLLREAAEIPIRPKVTLFPLEEANRALQMLKADEIQGTGVLVVS